MKHSITSGSSFVITLELTDEQIHMGYHSGECHDDILKLMELPEIKKQLDNISEKDFNDWWKEFNEDALCDVDTTNYSKEDKLSWLIFDCCSLGVDGYFD